VLPPPPARVLDVACGPGRHVRALGALGYDVVGVEIDKDVAAAAREAGLDVRTLDMRHLRKLDGTFDAVLSMWASFGFFDDETNAGVLRAMSGKVRARGVLVLDVYDSAFFGPRWEGERVIRGIRVHEEKERHGNRLWGSISYDGVPRDELEWRLYSAAEIAALVPELELVTACAGWDESRRADGAEPRMQLVLRRR
jgi:SAM-dependent methyltransferase